MKKKKIVKQNDESESFWNSKLFGLNIINITLVLGFLIFGFFYVFFNVIPAGVLSFLFLFLLIARDVLPKSYTQSGVLQAIKELVIAAVWAVGFWLVLSFILNTSSPVDVVTSCSMLPVLHRGDLLLLEGGFVNAQTFYFNSSFPTINLLKKQCVETVNGVFNGFTPCTYGVKVDNQTFFINYSNDVIVYAAKPSYYGFIVHRVFLKLVNQSNGETFYLTKGDNNAVLDQEAGVSIVSQNNVIGRVIFDVPYVGYLKLLLFMQFSEPEGCNTTISYS